MENLNEQGASLFDLSIDPSSQQSLEQASKWAKFLAIVFICCAAIGALSFAFAGEAISRLFAYNPLFSSLSSIIFLVIIIVLAIFAVFITFLFRFASFTAKGIKETNQEDIEKGIGSLKIYFILGGVFGILGLLISLFGLAA